MKKTENMDSKNAMIILRKSLRWCVIQYKCINILIYLLLLSGRARCSTLPDIPGIKETGLLIHNVIPYEGIDGHTHTLVSAEFPRK